MNRVDRIMSSTIFRAAMHFGASLGIAGTVYGLYKNADEVERSRRILEISRKAQQQAVLTSLVDVFGRDEVLTLAQYFIDKEYSTARVQLPVPARVCFDKCTDIRPSFDLVLSAMDSTRDFNKKSKEEKVVYATMESWIAFFDGLHGVIEREDAPEDLIVTQFKEWLEASVRTVGKCGRRPVLDHAKRSRSTHSPHELRYPGFVKLVERWNVAHSQKTSPGRR
jgi:hypothetical protein